MCSSLITASPCFLVAEELPFHGFAADVFRLGGAQLGAAADPHLTALQRPWGPQPPNTQIPRPSLVLPPGTAAASLVSPALPHPHLFFPPLGLRGQLLCPPQGVTASPGAFQNLSQLAPSKPSQTQGSGETSQEGWASITTAHGLPWLKTPMAGFCHLPRSQPLPALLLLVLPAGHGAAHVGFYGWKGQRERAGAVAKGTVEVHCSPGQVISVCCFSGSRTVHEHDKTVFGCLEGKPGVNSGRRLEKKGTVLNVSGYPAHPYKRPVWRAPQSTTDWGRLPRLRPLYQYINFDMPELMCPSEEKAFGSQDHLPLTNWLSQGSGSRTHLTDSPFAASLMRNPQGTWASSALEVPAPALDDKPRQVDIEKILSCTAYLVSPLFP